MGNVKSRGSSGNHMTPMIHTKYYLLFPFKNSITIIIYYYLLFIYLYHVNCYLLLFQKEIVVCYDDTFVFSLVRKVPLTKRKKVPGTIQAQLRFLKLIRLDLSTFQFESCIYLFICLLNSNIRSCIWLLSYVNLNKELIFAA